MTKCIMLDVDGVLISGRPTDGQFWTHTMKDDIGLDPSVLVNAFFKEHWASVVTGQSDLIPTLAACLKRHGLDIEAEEIVAYWFANDARIIEDMVSDISDIRSNGIPVFLATNQDHQRAAYIMETLELGMKVDGIIYSAIAKAQKPEAAFFQFAEQSSGFSGTDILFIDDTLANIEGAARAGWNAVHWNGSNSLAEIVTEHSP